jgi:hypothetical protein
MERSMESSRKIFLKGNMTARRRADGNCQLHARRSDGLADIEFRPRKAPCRDMVYGRLWKLTFRATRPITCCVFRLPEHVKGIGSAAFTCRFPLRELGRKGSMSLLHIGVALCLSAAAAFLVTGAAMRTIEPDAAVICTIDDQMAGAALSCLSAGDTQPAGNIGPDAGRKAYGR